jgi:hypothetical protein
MKDMMSKHAMHANCAPQVLCAGEMCVVDELDWRRYQRQQKAGPLQQGLQQQGSGQLPGSSRQSGQLPGSRRQSGELLQQQQDDEEGEQEEQDHLEEEAEAQGLQQLPPRLRYRLVVDNNSGTYAPPAEGLASLRRLLESCFPGLQVEAVAVTDLLLLRQYHALCPDRRGR